MAHAKHLGGGLYQVPQWVIWSSIRYGMGRNTYANDESAELARCLWDTFHPYMRNQIRRDVARLHRDQHSEIITAPWKFLEDKGGIEPVVGASGEHTD